MNTIPPSRTYPPITRDQIVEVCAISNDLSPLHTDPEFARAAGYHDVLVPGMFLLAWLGEFIERWAGVKASQLVWKARLRKPLWPQDVVTIAAESGSNQAGKVTATKADGEIVGTAEFEVIDG